MRRVRGWTEGAPGGNPPRRTINLVRCDPVLLERIRASLKRGPFLCAGSPEPLPPERVDLYVVEAATAGRLAEAGVPVIAWGPASAARGAFLAGCEDFLREPWSPEELEARILAALGRQRMRQRFPWGEVTLEGSRLAAPGGRVELSRHESLILRALLRSRGNPVPREALSLLASGRAAERRSRAVDVHVSCLRRKVRAVAPGAARFITCVRGQGYMIE